MSKHFQIVFKLEHSVKRWQLMKPLMNNILFFATNDFHFKCAKLSIISTLIKTKSDSKVMIKRKVASRNGKDPRAYVVTARSAHPPLSRLIFASEFTIRKMMDVRVNNQLSYLSPQTKYLQG